MINENYFTPFDMVIVLDMSGSMAQSTNYPVNANNKNGYLETRWERIENSCVQKTLDTVNQTIDSLMVQNRQNRVAVCVYGANAAVLMPLTHYQRDDEQPYLSIGGMETLHDRDDYSTPAELGQPELDPMDGIWNINQDACYTVVARALYDQSDATPETLREI